MRSYWAVILLAGLPLAACSDNSPGGKAVHARREHFEVFGKAFKGIDEELKLSTPDLVQVQANAAKIAELAPHMKTWFPAGSGPQDGKRTDAKAEIWTQRANFEQAADRLANAVATLSAASKANNIVATRAAANALGAACKGCHDKFKED